MRLPRFTLRRMMVVVAVAGLGLGIEMTRERRVVLLAIESRHAADAAMYRQSSNLYASSARKQRDLASKTRQGFATERTRAKELDQVAGLIEGEAQGYRTLADYHEAMRAKYRQAARFPFLAVEPDPPSPPGANEF
jgi:hypothetical protein